MPHVNRQKPQARQPRSKSVKNSEDYELYIMRHGKAAPRGPAYSDDAKRPLTPQGIKDLQEVSRGLIRLGVEVDWIVSSPLVRARETAQIVAESFTPRAPVEITEALNPGAAAEALLAFLAKHSARKSTLLIGHESDLSKLACQLIGANPDAGLALKKSGCCLITFPDLPQLFQGHLLWWLTPRVLRRMA